MRLLDRVGKQLVGAVHIEAEMLAVMGRALVVEELQKQRQRLLLDIAPRVEIDAEAVELVFAITGPKSQREPALARATANTNSMALASTLKRGAISRRRRCRC